MEYQLNKNVEFNNVEFNNLKIIQCFPNAEHVDLIPPESNQDPENFSIIKHGEIHNDECIINHHYMPIRIDIINTSCLIDAGIFSDLCNKVLSQDVFAEVGKLCEEFNTIDISYNIVASLQFIKYISSGKPHDIGYCLYIPMKRVISFRCNLKLFDWYIVSGLPVFKGKNITDTEVVVAILFALTDNGWPLEYYAWLTSIKNYDTQEELEDTVKQASCL